MGGSCYRNPQREAAVVGAWCENNCFTRFGGCEASLSGDTTKPSANCELRPDTPFRLRMNMAEILAAIKDAVQKGKELFLYTPDIFQAFYRERVLDELPDQGEGVYLAVTGCIRSFIDSGVSFETLRRKGIREVWLGVESASLKLRDLYDKPPFSNDEVSELTEAGRDAGVNVCWFLVDGSEDTDATRLATYNLMRRCEPYRVQIGTVQRFERAVDKETKREPALALA